MPRLLGDVDPHDALEQRVNAATAQGNALHMVDRVLAAEHEDEEELREDAPEPNDLSCLEAHESRQSRDVEPGTVDELLEHQRVLCFLDDLVIGIAKHGGPIGEAA